MDSLTQLTVGAACGEAVLGPRVGRKALLWGAILGTLPDLDVLIPMGGPVNDFVYHRGFSHSVFLLALLSPVLAWGITRIHPNTKQHFKGWLFLSLLVLEVSVLLDLLTIYGTQVLWPFDTTPLAWPIFFIIDPLFTLPVLLGVLAALVLKRSEALGHRLNTIGLCLAAAYTLWALGAGAFVETRVRDELSRRDVSYSRFVASPAPFTTLLWRVVGVDEETYFETYVGLLDGDAPLNIRRYPRGLELLKGLEEHPPVVKLRWFTRGYYALDRKGDHVVMTDLRMGSEPDYVFRFKVAVLSKGNPIPEKDARVQTRLGWRGLAWVWRRIWNPVPPPEPGP